LFTEFFPGLYFNVMNEEQQSADQPAELGQVTKAERKQRRREEKQREREREAKRHQRGRIWRWGGMVLGLVVVAGGVWLTAGRGSGGDSSGGGLVNLTVQASDWTKGNQDAPAVLIEYGDFQCPACALFYPEVKRLSEEMGGNLLVVFRHFPLRQTHRQAQLAAQAAEAAGQQDKFWEMHNILYERQDDWSDNSGARDMFIGYAEELGLDRARFEADIDSSEVADKVNQQYQSGLSAGVDATPTFYLNGEKLQGYRTYDDFSERIRQAAGENS
jgi:protein-disulfide isomerase